VEWWWLMHEVVGREKGYSEAQIKEYGKYIRMIKDMVK
jgi:hypothetical protein